MRITAIETFRLGAFPNLCWVLVHTDQGITGLGETFFGPEAVAAYIHETAAPRLLGRDPRRIEAHAVALRNYLGWGSAGVETRGNSALDIALWDIFARSVSLPLADALGGRARDAIRTYNTCAGPAYVREAKGQLVETWGLPKQAGRLEDLDAFLHRADELAEDLLSQGITAMKIWPFDIAAERSQGMDITAAELRAALAPFEKIRARVGDAIDIMVEFHSLWDLPMACRLARELRPFNTYWHEDPFRLETPGDLRHYAPHSTARVCASETMAGVHAFREYLATGIAGVAMLDLAWCGGITEAKRIAALADAHGVPIAPHDCTGPVVYAASCHLSLHARNTLIQESVRAFYLGWYAAVVDYLPTVADGMITVPDRPGHGVELSPAALARPDAIRRISRI